MDMGVDPRLDDDADVVGTVSIDRASVSASPTSHGARCGSALVGGAVAILGPIKETRASDAVVKNPRSDEACVCV